MKFNFVVTFIFVAFSVNLWGQQPSGKFESETIWPGVTMQVAKVDRIADNRLMILIRLLATGRARPSTMIGQPAVIPPNATKEEIASGVFRPEPFSLESSVMFDEQSGIKYETLPPQSAGSGHVYRPSVLLASLSPGQSVYMSIQFAAPSLLPPDGLGRPVPQTMTLVMANAKTPILKIPVPSPTPSQTEISPNR